MYIATKTPNVKKVEKIPFAFFRHFRSLLKTGSASYAPCIMLVGWVFVIATDVLIISR